MLFLTEEIAGEIRAHGAADYPNETCGALLGLDSERGREVRALFPLTNRRDDSPRNRFSVTADDVRGAERAAAEAGIELIGWYHSHPDHPAKPSEFDRDHAWPWYSYIIVSVTAAVPQVMTSWLLADDRSQFHEEKIEVHASAGPTAGPRV